jgi:hypothetical protein
MLCAFNFSNQSTTYSMPQNIQIIEIVPVPGLVGASAIDGILNFEAFSGLLLRVV